MPNKAWKFSINGAPSFLSQRTSSLPCRQLVFDSYQQELLTALLATEEECWYLDEDGERLSSKRLFELSPWHVVGPHGPFNVLHLHKYLRWTVGDSK